MPGYGLAFAVRVSGEIDGVALLYAVGEPFDDRLLIGVDDVFRLKAVLDIHAERLFGEVPDVPAGSVDDIILAQIFLDCLCLARRFHDDQIH